MGKKIEVDEERVISLYGKYKTLNRTALSAGCAPGTVKKILLKNGIELNKYTPKRFNVNSIRY